jgi:hypothetical protein
MTSTTAPPPAVTPLRWRLTTTPGRMRLTAAVLALAAIVLGIVAASAASSRRDAAHAVASTSEPQLLQAENLYASLSDADATAATTFLTGGFETASLRRRYLRDIATASSFLIRLSRRSGDGPERRAALTLAHQLPLYTGLIEAARANNREGFPVGAAYLRRASTLMRGTLLGAAEDLYVVEAHRTNGDYETGTANRGLIALAIIAGVLAILLAITQIGLARFSNRILNIPLVVATVLVVIVAAWVLAGLVAEQNALAAAQRKGSDSVQVLSAARDLLLRAQRDDSLALIGRGGDTTSLADFAKAMVALRGAGTGRGGVLAQAEQIARQSATATQVRALKPMLARFEAVHRGVAASEQRGHFNDAVALYNAAEAARADALNHALEGQTAAAQRRFVREAGSATSAVSAMDVGIPLIALAIAALAVLGLAPRIREYR